MKILLVEDDEHLALVLQAVLTEQHHTVDVAPDGQTGWALAETFTYDLVLLDVMLPNLDGISLCRRLRAAKMSMPILLLTAKHTSDDKVMGFDAGADDYVVKPFDPQELVARIRALLRRGSSPLPLVLEWGSLHLDPSTCEVKYEEQILHLTPKEYGLLELFLRNSTRVFSRSAILEQLWSFEEPPAEETVRAHIKGLRQKLKGAGAPTDLIETVYGLGYRLKPLNTARSEDSSGLNEPLKVSHSIASEASNRHSGRTRGTATTLGPAAKPLTLNTAPAPSVPSATQQQTQAAVNRLWEQFKGPIKNRVNVIEDAIVALEKGRLSDELLKDAGHAAHKLSGSLGTYGFPEGSRLAQKLEHVFFSGSVSQDQVPQLFELVRALRAELEHKPLERSPAPAQLPSTSSNEPSVLLVIESDEQLTEQLVTEVRALGMRSKVAPDWTTARDAIASENSDVVVLDLSSAETASEGLQLLSELTNRSPSLPVLVITGRDGFADRLEVARRGGRAFLQKPVSSSQITDVVVDVLQRFHTHQSKVMIVDDDPHVQAALRTLLKPWGFKLTALEDPHQFWDTLESCMPDLLILDVEMPQLSGIELCQVVRNEPRWSGLPVLFLTAHTDADTVHQVFACGGDDYVTKPVVGPELVTRILNRLERTQLLRTMAETDPLTGLANRRKSIQDLNQLLRLGDRYNQPLCFAIIDLDHFKQVNDSYGHAAGDTVLRRLGEMLLRTFRSEDVVARWGGEEFIVGMYGMTKKHGVARLVEFLALWRQELFPDSNGSEFAVTFSAGVAEYPLEGSDLQLLYRCADKALYQAKAAGRNCIMPAIGN